MDKKELKAQTKIWYKKLKDQGFEDVEESNGFLKRTPIGHLRIHRDYFPEDQVTEIIKQKYEDKSNYFRLAGQFYHTHNFKSELDRKIWQLHSEGEKLRDIGTKVDRSKTSVEYRINIMRRLMLIEAAKDEENV